jgi:hypothetical protein
MYDELHAICDQHGLFLRREVLALGYTDKDLARSMRAKVIHRVRHGSYVFVDHWATLSVTEQHRVRAMAVLRTAKTGLMLSHTTAVIAHGAPVWELSLAQVHVTRRDRRGGRNEAGVVQHRGLLLPSDVVEVGGAEVTSPTRTALDLTTIADVEHCLPVFDHLLHVGATSKSLLHEGSRAMRLWHGTLNTDLVIRLTNPRCESVGESRTWFLFWRHGVVAPETGYVICDSSGRVIARLDFAWPTLGVFLEFDGKEKYLKHRRPGESVVDAVLREKKREERICRLTGWRCIRITWADLYRPAETARYINSVLAGGPVHV